MLLPIPEGPSPYPSPPVCNTDGNFLPDTRTNPRSPAGTAAGSVFRLIPARLANAAGTAKIPARGPDISPGGCVGGVGCMARVAPPDPGSPLPRINIFCRLCHFRNNINRNTSIAAPATPPTTPPTTDPVDTVVEEFELSESPAEPVLEDVAPVPVPVAPAIPPVPSVAVGVAVYPDDR